MSKRHWLLLLALAAALPFLPTLSHDFVFDDMGNVVEHEALHSWSAIPDALAMWKRTLLNYRPVRFVSLALDWNLGGGAPWVFHLTNVLLHVLVTLLFKRLLDRLGISAAVAWTAAFLFAVNPNHVGTVAYISARKDLLVTLFYLAALLAFLSYRTNGGAWRAAGVFAFGILAAFSKENAVTLPIVLLLVDAWRSTGSMRERFARACAGRRVFYGTWLLGGGAYVFYKTVVAPATKVDRSQWMDVVANTGTAAHIWAIAMRKIVLPLHTVPDYQGRFAVGQGWDGTSLLGALLVAGLVALAATVRRRHTALCAGIAFWLISWLPTSGVFPIAELFAEHYLYLPSLGFCLAAGAASVLLWRRVGVRTSRAAARLALGGTCVVLAAWALLLAPAWADPEHVWQTSLTHNPNSARAASGLSILYQEQGRSAEARRLAEQAAALAPGMDTVRANHLGVLFAQGRVEDVIRLAEAALEDVPDSYRVRLILARALRAKGRLGEAVDVLTEVVARSPEPRHLGVLGETAYMARRYPEAVAALERAVAATPDYSGAWTNLGLVRLALGDTLAAERDLRQAIQADAANANAHRNLAVILFFTGRYTDARHEADTAVRLGLSLHPDFEKALEAALSREP